MNGESLNLQDIQSGRVYPLLPGQRIQVGRQDPNWNPDIACPDRHVSRRHCQIQATADGRVQILDQSTYGTYVNGQKISGEAFARPGDRLILGHQYELRVLATNPLAQTVAAGSASASATSGTTASSGSIDSQGRIPKHLAGRYRMLQELGRGGMGVVYKAQDEQTGADCAVKCLFSTDEEERTERFEREARLAEKLGDYPAIVKVYDSGHLPDGQGLYLVMEYVDGVSLGTMAKSPVEQRLAARLVARTARAVAYAHERGIIHRDLKPENVLVTRDEQAVRLTDFGIAKEDGSGLTVTGITMGTPNYMAPEQIEDVKRAGPLADVYGLGGILYSLLTGRPPYKGKSLGVVLRKVQKGLLTPPSDVVDDLNPELDAICRRALSVDPKDRPQSARALVEELEAWLKTTSESSESVRLKAPEH